MYEFMNRVNFERLYEERGLMDYKLKTLQDLFYIYGVKLNQIDGYSKLDGDGKVKVKEFVMNYYNSYGLERRNISILKIIKSSNSLRIEFTENGELRVGNIELGIKN